MNLHTCLWVNSELIDRGYSCEMGHFMQMRRECFKREELVEIHGKQIWKIIEIIESESRVKEKKTKLVSMNIGWKRIKYELNEVWEKKVDNMLKLFQNFIEYGSKRVELRVNRDC